MKKPEPPRWSELTALFGGMFDPPHLGHREAVRGLFTQPGIGRVRILPAGQPSYKGAHTVGDHRLAMAELNFRPTPTDSSYPSEIFVDSCELQRSKLTLEPTFTFHTLMEFQNQTGQRPAFVIGVDQLVQFHQWYQFPKILELAHWIILERRFIIQELAGEMPRADQVLYEWKQAGLIQQDRTEALWHITRTDCFMILVSTQAPAISSTRIRQDLARTGQVPRGTLLPEVEAYLKQNRLYGMRTGD